MRLTFYQILTALALSLLFMSCVSKEASRRPNFLFVLVDDQSPFDLQVYDAKSILETPAIDRVAREGMVFESARHMGAMLGAVCTPSRHMIMSGRTLWNLPPIGKAFHNPDSPDSLELQTIGAVFNRAGYQTMRTCKKGNSYAAANAQFTVVKDASKRGGTEESGSAWHGKQVLDYLDDRESEKITDPFFIYFGFPTRMTPGMAHQSYWPNMELSIIRIPQVYHQPMQNNLLYRKIIC